MWYNIQIFVCICILKLDAAMAKFDVSLPPLVQQWFDFELNGGKGNDDSTKVVASKIGLAAKPPKSTKIGASGPPAKRSKKS